MKLNKSHKAQATQMFTYIFAIIVIGLILLFGVRAIGKLNSDIETINVVKFKSQIEKTTQEYAYQYGSWTTQDFSVPNEVEFVCFFDLEKANLAQSTKICGGSGASDPNQAPSQPTVCDAWQSGTQNVMTIPHATDTPIEISKIQTDNDIGYVCFPVTSGKFSATIEGLGDGVKIY